MTTPLDYTIRQKLLWLEPGETWKYGILTVHLFVNADTMRWVIQGAGVVQVFRYPRFQGRKSAARVAIASYILAHHRGEAQAA